MIYFLWSQPQREKHRELAGARLRIRWAPLLRYKSRNCTQSVQSTEWRLPLSCVLSVMMVFLARLAEGGGCSPTPFHSINPSTRVMLNPHPSPARLARHNYLYSPTPPLSPSLWPKVSLSSSVFRYYKLPLQCTVNYRLLPARPG